MASPIGHTRVTKNHLAMEGETRTSEGNRSRGFEPHWHTLRLEFSV